MQSIQFSILRCLCRREKDRRRLRRIKGFLFFIVAEIQLIIEISLLVLKVNEISYHPCITCAKSILFFPVQRDAQGLGPTLDKAVGSCSLATPSKLQNLDHPNQQKQPVPYNQAA